MVKCTKGQVRRLKTALRWKGDPQRRQRIQMVLLRESEMTQPAIAGALGVSLSTVNRAHMAYDRGGLKALKSRPSGGRKRRSGAFYISDCESNALTHVKAVRHQMVVITLIIIQLRLRAGPQTMLRLVRRSDER
jgi:Winged helix-turn helix